MKTIILSAVLMLAVSFIALSHDAEVTRESICQRGPGVYFLEVNKVFYRTTVVEKGGLIFIDNPPHEAAGGLCYCRDQKEYPPILVCD
ncbi:hypothetical protein GCM10008090_30760 [Arenicella chitinivorans]|uniref:Uncharacterized protein n=1 Tax=Arenicella chitinivorans TaxID=1329800 RepID=A0A918S1B8_9GAMM|nr:hypothetical protein [Arenicella chitinivorans]GHA18936.1 hypothetical protein GCM10008090_30760 [Arenicella chitinivorans]